MIYKDGNKSWLVIMYEPGLQAKGGYYDLKQPMVLVKGAEIRRVRLFLGLNQREFADLCAFEDQPGKCWPATHISMYERTEFKRMPLFRVWVMNRAVAKAYKRIEDAKKKESRKRPNSRTA